jgi:hypothetical protein
MKELLSLDQHFSERQRRTTRQGNRLKTFSFIGAGWEEV